jgi:iron complex transport system substrate-binding protein
LLISFAALCDESVIFQPTYSQGFRVIEVDGNKLVQIRDLRDLKKSPENFPVNQLFKALALTSTTHYPMVQMIGLANNVIAVSGKKYFQTLATKKNIIELGQVPNAEKLKSISGLFLLAHVESSDELEALDKLQRLKIPLFKMRDHLELHLLGRSEWIIALGYILGKEELAKALFKDIESRYLNLAWKFAPLKLKVVVASQQGDQWNLKSPDGPFGRIFLDAGVVLPKEQLILHKEKFHEFVMDSDICLIEGLSTSLKELSKTNPLIKNWNCVKKKMIFNYDKLLSKAGGNDFWETAVSRPDLLLQEYMTLFHVSLYQPNQLRWYKVIK